MFLYPGGKFGQSAATHARKPTLANDDYIHFKPESSSWSATAVAAAAASKQSILRASKALTCVSSNDKKAFHSVATLRDVGYYYFLCYTHRKSISSRRKKEKANKKKATGYVQCVA